MEQVMAMLGQLGYKEADGNGAPWVSIKMDSMNGKAVEQILDWYTEHGFYNMAAVSEIKEEEGQWQAKLFMTILTILQQDLGFMTGQTDSFM